MVGEEVGRTMSRKITDSMGKAGSDSAGAFADSFQKRLRAALDKLPKAKIDAESSAADRKVAELRERMEVLLGKEIGVDISSKDAMKELALIDSGLSIISHKAKNIDLKFNTKEAQAQLAGLATEIGAESAAGGGGGGAARTGLGALATPQGITAGIGAALAGLPFIAQAAAGGIVSALGGALAGMAIYGASKVKSVQKNFADLKTSATNDLKQIGKSFVPVLNDILTNARNVMNQMTPVFAGAERVIAGPFRLLADSVIKSFTEPAVKTSIDAVAVAFAKIMNAFRPDVPGLAASLAQAITRIANAISSNPKAFADFLNFLGQIVVASLDAIAALTEVATWIEKNWKIIQWIVIPEVAAITQSIQHWDEWRHDTAAIFGGVRHDIATFWDLVYSNSIGSVIRISHNVETQFNSMRHEIAVIFNGIRHDISHIWDLIYSDTIGAVTRIWQHTDSPFAHERHDLANTFNGIRHDMAAVWNSIYNDTLGKVTQLARDVNNRVNAMRHSVLSTFNGLRHDIGSAMSGIASDSARAWNIIWNNTIGRAASGIRTLEGYFSGFRSWLNGYFSGAANWLYNVGRNIVDGLLSGIRAGMGGIGGWIKGNVYNPIINAVKHYFGVHSPASSMVPIGSSLIQGLLQGMFNESGKLGGFIKTVFGGWTQALGNMVEKGFIDIAKLPGKALNALGKVGGAIGSFFSKLVGGGGSGVGRWAGTVAQALSLLHLPQSLAPQVMRQISTESGGNPNAINLTDINAQMGDPSRGLLQTIGSTFAAYHVAGTSSNIYDPLANIAAAINYAAHVYGPSLMRGGMGLGSGHGYDSGGWLPPGATMAYNGTGAPELVLTRSQIQAGAAMGGSSGPTYVAHFDSLTGAAIESHVRTAYTVMALTQGKLQRQGRRS